MLTMRGGGDAGTSIAARTAARLTRACIADAQLGESVIGHAERRAEAVLRGVTRCYTVLQACYIGGRVVWQVSE